MMKFVRYGTTGPNITSLLILLINDLYLDRDSMTIFYGYMKTDKYVFLRGYTQVL
jgi:hypothetical protein